MGAQNTILTNLYNAVCAYADESGWTDEDVFEVFDNMSLSRDDLISAGCGRGFADNYAKYVG